MKLLLPNVIFYVAQLLTINKIEQMDINYDISPKRIICFFIIFEISLQYKDIALPHSEFIVSYFKLYADLYLSLVIQVEKETVPRRTSTEHLTV